MSFYPFTPAGFACNFRVFYRWTRVCRINIQGNGNVRLKSLENVRLGKWDVLEVGICCKFREIRCGIITIMILL